MGDQASDPTSELLEAASRARSGREAARGAEQQTQIIRFRAGRREFAIALDAVERTERLPTITPVPRSPAYVRGVASLRGDVVCVLDLAVFLDGAPPAELKCLLIVSDGRRRLAVTSESLPDFQRITVGRLIPHPAADPDVYRAAIDQGGALVGMIDPARLFEAVERRLGHV